MSVRDKDAPIYCGYCGYRISESDDLAGNYEKRGDSVILHRACGSSWDREYSQHLSDLESAIEEDACL